MEDRTPQRGVDEAENTESLDTKENETEHCVRCHKYFFIGNEEGCCIRAGRDTQPMLMGRLVDEVCLQCCSEHGVSRQPFCFQGKHTTDPEKANWGVSDESDPLDFPSPKAQLCSTCELKIWA
mmetsp:Transcript_9397/g.11699  ORF Transcript_9397/g.11699 Transcript_9397/m.11699 type:complete len:123 (+) Transcript_9397:206-574(+)